jgi:hypothetical protein
MKKALAAVAAVVVLTLVGCGGGSSGWSTSDRNRFRDGWKLDADRPEMRCLLGTATKRFNNFSDYVRSGTHGGIVLNEDGNAYLNEVKANCLDSTSGPDD